MSASLKSSLSDLVDYGADIVNQYLYSLVLDIFQSGTIDGALYSLAIDSVNQTSIGTTPVTVATDPIGLMMDTRFNLALGAELVDTMNTAAAWTASGTNTVEQDGDAVKVTFVDTSTGANSVFSAAAGLNSNLTAGANYKISYEVKVNSGSCNVAVINASTNNNVVVTSTSYIQQSFVFTANHATANSMGFTNMGAGEIVWIKNISVKLLEGNHAIQATAAARPTWTNRVNLLTHTEDMTTLPTYGTPVSITTTADIPAGASAATIITTDAMYEGVDFIDLTIGLTYTAQITAKGSLGTESLILSNALVNILDQPLSTTYTTYTVTFTATQLRCALLIKDAGTIKVSKWQIEYGTAATRYQRVTTATDFDTVGFPYYAKFLGVDDSLTSATGGASDAGFFWCGVVEPTGGAGTNRYIWNDRVASTGYIVQLDVNNKFSLNAGTGIGFVLNPSTATVNVGTKYLLTCWDDGVNLNVQINSAAVETIARPVVVAGSVGYSIGVRNQAVQYLFIGNLYPSVYFKNTAGTAAQRADAQAWARSMAGM